MVYTCSVFTRYALILSSFCFNAPATTEIYTFPYTTLFRSGVTAEMYDWVGTCLLVALAEAAGKDWSRPRPARPAGDRKSTRLNSSHQIISYAVFCLKKKKRENVVIHNALKNRNLSVHLTDN